MKERDAYCAERRKCACRSVAPCVMEVQQYGTLNAAMRSKYVME